MFFLVIFSLIFGLFLGILAGLVPGLHPNTVLIVLVSSAFLFQDQPVYVILTIIVSMSISNTIVNFIPSILLGAPEPDSCLSVLPGHKLLLLGRGYEALFLTVVGGVAVIFFTVIAYPFLLWFIPIIYGNIQMYIHWMLGGIVIILLSKERKRLLSGGFFLISGLMGVSLLSVIPDEEILFPVFTGFFGLPVIISSIREKRIFPKQKKTAEPRWPFLNGSVASWIAGLVVGILPALGSAQAGVFVSRFIRNKEKDFLIALGGINTANILFTFIALYTLSKTRSGAAWALKEIVGKITLNELNFILIISCVACFISALFTLKAGKFFIKILENVDYRMMNLCVFFLLLFLLITFGGFFGLLLSALCAAVGLGCIKYGVKKMYLMGFLVLPTIIYFTNAGL
jgi:putative membrane protein